MRRAWISAALLAFSATVAHGQGRTFQDRSYVFAADLEPRVNTALATPLPTLPAAGSSVTCDQWRTTALAKVEQLQILAREGRCNLPTAHALCPRITAGIAERTQTIATQYAACQSR